MLNKKADGKTKIMRFIVIIIMLISYWDIKCFFALKTADAYLKKKYNVEMTYKEMRFQIADAPGYYITYYSADNSNNCFSVYIFSSLSHPRKYIRDNYLVNWFSQELQEHMNMQFSENLEALGDGSRIKLYVNPNLNDDIDENKSIFDIQKEIPYEIILRTDCTDEDMIRDLCSEIKSQGYKPQEIRY